ncbi:GGDEF domain-containing protein [Olsenella sp. DNF00959]|uniref:GGDEF domain-containing protein n=1 Tax=Olsenella sp. DNF00959 TaxID=1476999 RepID=UPI000785DC4C|nr:GGDEF domain-containing protein [Olsenella sp. DNF00959]KXB62765.1 diguanylate cyclase domain protein [Olsenella sp. DNF00959]
MNNGMGYDISIESVGGPHPLSVREVLQVSFGFRRQTPFERSFITNANLNYGAILSSIVAVLECYMLQNSARMSSNPQVVEKMGMSWIAQHSAAYAIQMLSALFLIACTLAVRNCRKRPCNELLSRAAIIQFIVICIAFGIYISLGDIARSNGMYAFLTQMVSIVCIFVVKPFIFIPILFGTFSFMLHAANEAGALTHGSTVNLQILCLTLMTSCCIKHYKYVRGAQTRERLARYSYHDELTGLHNTRALQQDHARWVGKRIAFAIIDIDNFKHYNDAFGHLMGDRILSLLASGMSINLDEHTRIYRMGGDEFALVSSSLGKEGLRAYIEHGRASFQTRASQNGLEAQGHPLGFSIGIAEDLVSSTEDVQRLMREADRAMYEEKRKRHARRDSVEVELGG